MSEPTTQYPPDRPWVGRGYGRLRVDEPHAKDLLGIVNDELGRWIAAHKEAKLNGRDANAAKFAMRRASRLRDGVKAIIVEQGWASADDLLGEQ
jgi:hypothetical protein